MDIKQLLRVQVLQLNFTDRKEWFPWNCTEILIFGNNKTQFNFNEACYSQ